MKEALIKTIQDIVGLLATCGWNDEADWFNRKARKLEESSIESDEFYRELEELDKNIAGMGSFDDIPLRPPKESGLTKKEADAMQWELGARLGDITEKLLMFRRNKKGDTCPS